MPASPAQNGLIAQIYIGYFNRAPDPEGMRYWTGQLEAGMSATAIAESFSRQPEALSAYSYFTNRSAGADAFIFSVYDNLFNHGPDAAGLAYWKDQLAAGKPAGQIILDIISGAQGADKTVIDNKVSVAGQYLAHLAGASGEVFRLGDARRAVADVTDNIASVSAAVQSLERLGGGNGLTLTILDASGTLAPYESDIRSTVAAAWDLWAVHFTRTASIEIEITYAAGAPNVLASAGSAIEVYTGEIFNGRRVTQAGVVQELITGFDPNGQAADGRITLAADLSRLFFRDSVTDSLPSNKFDALSIFAHEFGHVLGFRSALDINGLAQRGYITSYDRYVSGASAGTLKFQGRESVDVKGGAVPLASSGPSHLDVAGDLMASSIGVGQTKLVGVLDVAVLMDIGAPVSLGAFDGFA